MHEYIEEHPPDGSRNWEARVCIHASDVWSEGRPGSACRVGDDLILHPEKHEEELEEAEETSCMSWREFVCTCTLHACARVDLRRCAAQIMHGLTSVRNQLVG